MKTFLSIFIFCIVLFLYIHIHFHLKTSDDLEIFEIDCPSKNALEDICDLRQPITFSIQNDKLFNACSQKNILDRYGAFDVKIRNTQSTLSVEVEKTCGNLHSPIHLHSSLRVIAEDKNAKYISENNTDFLTETGLSKVIRANDSMLRPYMVCKTIYDIMFGSNNSSTPLRYNINYRNFFYVTEGTAKVKLIPPRSSKYLHSYKDYYNFEFRSPINPWNVQSQYKNDYGKVQSLEVILKKGDILFVPAYWWYSITFESNTTTILSMHYRTYMNVAATLPYFAMHVLQRQNTKMDIVPTSKIIDSTEKQNDVHQASDVNNTNH